MAAHHIDAGARAAATDVAEVHDADDLLHIVIGAEVGAATYSPQILLEAAIDQRAPVLSQT